MFFTRRKALEAQVNGLQERLTELLKDLAHINDTFPFDVHLNQLTSSLRQARDSQKELNRVRVVLEQLMQQLGYQWKILEPEPSKIVVLKREKK